MEELPVRSGDKVSSGRARNRYSRCRDITHLKPHQPIELIGWHLEHRMGPMRQNSGGRQLSYAAPPGAQRRRLRCERPDWHDGTR